MNVSERPLIIDVSEHQGQLNYNALSGNPDKSLVPHIIISRAGLGKYGHMDDKQFVRNWEKCKQFGYFRQSYYAYWPWHPAGRQLDEWFKINPTIDVLPRVIDLEENAHDVEAEFIADRMWEWSEEILRRDGYRPWIYSRKNLIDPWLASWTDEMLNAHYYIIAEYNNRRDQEEEGFNLPNRVNANRCVAKQTADKMELGPNLPIIDRDRWMLGDALQLDDWITTNYSGDVPSPPPVDPFCEELSTKLDNFINDYAEDYQQNQDALLTLRLMDTSLEDGCKRNYSHIEDLHKLVSGIEALINLNAVMLEGLISVNTKNITDGQLEIVEDILALEAKQKEDKEIKMKMRFEWLKHEPIKLIAITLLEWWPEDGVFYLFDIMILRLNFSLWIE